MTNLRRLELHHDPGITDAGLKHLVGPTHVAGVEHDKTKVTGGGGAALQKALPKARVVGN